MRSLYIVRGGIVLFFCLFLITLQGCKESDNIMFGPYKIDETDNKFDGYKIYCMNSNNLLEKEADMSLSELFRPIPTSGTHFLLEKVVSKDSDAYYVVIEYNSSDWLFIRDDIDLKIIYTKQDGAEETIPLLPVKNTKKENIISGSHIQEILHYSITVDQIRALSEAKAAKLRLMGKKGFVVRYFYFVNIQYLKNFLGEPFIKGGK